MAAKTADAQTFEAYLERLRDEARRLACYVRAYRKLHERRHDHLVELNIAPGFFTTVTSALFSAIVLLVANLFDQRGQRGLHHFLTFVEDHRELFTRRPIHVETIQRDRGTLRNFAPLASARLRRNKIHAHFDKDYFLDPKGLAEEAPLRWVDLEETVKLVESILNRYSAAYNGNRLVLEPLNAGDLDDLLDELRRASEAT